MGDIIVKGHIISSYYNGIYVKYYPDDKRDYLKKIWLEEGINKVFSFSPWSNNNIVITGYSQYFNEKEAYIAYGEDRIIEGRPYVHLHVLVLDMDEYKKANYNIFNTDVKFISYENFRKNEISLQRELRVNQGIMNSPHNDVDNILNNWLNGNRTFYSNDPTNLIKALARRIGGNFTYVTNLSPKDPSIFDIIVYRGRGTDHVPNYQSKQLIMDYVEKTKSTEKIFKFVNIYQFLKSLNIEMKDGKSYQEALIEFIKKHCHHLEPSGLYYKLEAVFGEKAIEIFNHTLKNCPNSYVSINDPYFIQAISKIEHYPDQPLRNIIENIKKQEKERERNYYLQNSNGDYKGAYEKLSQNYRSLLEIIDTNSLKETIPYLTKEERKKLIVEYLKKSYLNLFDKSEIKEVIKETIRNKDGLLIIGPHIHDYLDRNTKCFNLLIQWIENNKVEDAYVYKDKIKHAFSDLLNTKKGKIKQHVDLSDLALKNKEVIGKIEILSNYLEEEDRKYIQNELKRIKKGKSDKKWKKY
ncbi:hypothetical protein WIW89_01185 [Stygiolobus sp. CP850M]|uniref:hypothetical protein n=1 Tax=Stygiolobus sp. CP850M TaxID=3133134 RepID=UPI00307F44E3